ncbi:FABP family protein, partial [Mycobacterium canetti]|uniref:FABP family protein n=3 Tax=Mycobacterium canetti TaxID=78331 RepID=UPI0022491A37
DLADGPYLIGATPQQPLNPPRCGTLTFSAHPSGITEIEVGTYSVTGDVIELELSTRADGSIGLAPTAKEVTALDRSYRIDGDELSYSLQMRAVGQPLQDHLAAVLHRQR